MGAHNDTQNDYISFGNGTQTLADPGADGTVDLRGRDRGVLSFSSGTRRLPNLPSTHIGVSVIVDAGGSVTVANAAGTTLSTLTSGQMRAYVWNGSSWTTSGGQATDVWLSDSTAYTAQTTVEGAIGEIYANHYTDVPVTSFVVNSGAQLTTFADNAASNPGLTPLSSGPLAIRWNNNNNSTGVMSVIKIQPRAAGVANTVTLNVMASKTSNTSGAGENSSFTVSAIPIAEGSAYDAFPSIGGTTTAMNGQAGAKVVQLVTLTLTSADLTGVNAIGLTLTPTQSTVNTDDLIMHHCWLSYDDGDGA